MVTFEYFILQNLSIRAANICLCYEIDSVDALANFVNDIEAKRIKPRQCGAKTLAEMREFLTKYADDLSKFKKRDERPYELKHLKDTLWVSLWRQSSARADAYLKEQQIRSFDSFLELMSQSVPKGFETLRPSTQLELKEMQEDILSNPLYEQIQQMDADLKKHPAKDLTPSDWLSLHGISVAECYDLSVKETSFIWDYFRKYGEAPIWYILEHTTQYFETPAQMACAYFGILERPLLITDLMKQYFHSKEWVKSEISIGKRQISNLLGNLREEVYAYLGECARLSDEALQEICKAQHTQLKPEQIRSFCEKMCYTPFGKNI